MFNVNIFFPGELRTHSKDAAHFPPAAFAGRTPAPLLSAPRAKNNKPLPAAFPSHLGVRPCGVCDLRSRSSGPGGARTGRVSDAW